MGKPGDILFSADFYKDFFCKFFIIHLLGPLFSFDGLIVTHHTHFFTTENGKWFTVSKNIKKTAVFLKQRFKTDSYCACHQELSPSSGGSFRFQ